MLDTTVTIPAIWLRFTILGIPTVIWLFYFILFKIKGDYVHRECWPIRFFAAAIATMGTLFAIFAVSCALYWAITGVSLV